MQTICTSARDHHAHECDAYTYLVVLSWLWRDELEKTGLDNTKTLLIKASSENQKSTKTGMTCSEWVLSTLFGYRDVPTE